MKPIKSKLHLNNLNLLFFDIDILTQVFMSSLKSNFNLKLIASNDFFTILSLIFIKSYLYIPLGGNKSFQLISLLLSFSFVSYWHGFGYAISIWSAINCSMIIAEIFYANYFLKLDFVKEAVSININSSHLKL